MGKGRKREREGERAEVFWDVLEAPQGHLVNAVCASEQGESGWEKVGGRRAGRKCGKQKSEAELVFTFSVIVITLYLN